jgi:selenide,water dikinase
MEAFTLLPDPQTNGGLLFTIHENSISAAQSLLEKNGLGDFAQPIGKMIQRSDKVIYVK